MTEKLESRENRTKNDKSGKTHKEICASEMHFEAQMHDKGERQSSYHESGEATRSVVFHQGGSIYQA
jgi:hypothetical protein